MNIKFWGCFLYLLALAPVASGNQPTVEEFVVRDPAVLNELAMAAFIERRKQNATETLDMDSPLMVKAKEVAVRRGTTRAPSELTMRKQLLQIGTDGGTKLLGDGNDISASLDNADTDRSGIMRLPANGGAAGALAAAVASAGTSGIVAVAGNTARAVAFSEQLTTGAISQAGALQVGPAEAGGWVALAEGKLRREAELSHSSLLWELGADLAESRQRSEGGLNVTHEAILLDNLQRWLQEQGGALSLAEPKVGREQGLVLQATEALVEGDVVLSLPFKSLMCRQTARNVLIGRSGKYLGEELGKTFDKVGRRKEPAQA